MNGALPRSDGAPAAVAGATELRLGYQALVLVCVATAVAVIVGNGDLALALAPVVLWALWFVPLRVSVLILLAAAWVCTSPGEVFAAGRVEPPWPMVGRMLWAKLNLVYPVRALVVSGFDLIILVLFVMVVHRHTQRSRIDRTGWMATPTAIGTFAWLSVLAVLWLSLYGLAQGGTFRFVLWQSVRWLYLPIVYAFMRQGLRGTQDAVVVGLVVLGAGLVKAVEAIVLRLDFPSYDVMAHATTHSDSVLFATCVFILGANLLERPSRRSLGFFLLLSPVYLWAMVANNRRLVWMELGLVAFILWFITPWGRMKRALARLAMLSALPLLLYFVVGWSSQSALFRPVQTVRSLVGSNVSASTVWRDLENYNLIFMFQDNPIFGSGFGHPAVERIKLPDVTSVYELEPYIPHNSVLGLWAFGGLVGFSLLWMVFPVGMFFTVRAYHWARTPLERVTALGAAAAEICYVVQGYGDLGFGTWGPLFTVAAGYALVGKICIARGAWPRARPASWKLGTADGISRRADFSVTSPHLARVPPLLK